MQASSSLVMSQQASPSGGQVTIVPQVPLGQNPKQVICPSCQRSVLTETNPQAGLLTYLLSCALCFMGCCLGCCLIPCCVAACLDTEHYCPKCRHLIGTHRKL